MDLNKSSVTNTSRGSRGFSIERDLPPVLAVYILTATGFILHVVVLKRRSLSDGMAKKSILLDTLSLVDIAFCVFLALSATFRNHVFQSEVLLVVLKYMNSISIYHSLVINFITFDSFLKIRLTISYDEETMERLWKIVIVSTFLVTIGLTVLHNNVYPFFPALFLTLTSLLFVNLFVTYIYIMYRMLQTRLHQPQVIGYFVNADGSKPDRRMKLSLRRRLKLPASFKKIIYSLPMQILFIHTILLVVPNFARMSFMIRGLQPATGFFHFSLIVSSLAVSLDSVVYLLISNKIIVHLFSKARIEPTTLTSPAPSQTNQSNVATITRDYSWAITNFSARFAWGNNLNSRKYEV